LTAVDSDGAKAGGRAQSLALFVKDSFTGVTRQVQSLSGGERFLTALALALALAEVVQRQSGGVDLGALFIDEGFGSLDVDTLETSIDVLRELQNSGRMIGVITHVEAMQAELPIGITVEKKSSGSTLKVGSAA
jgi:exonuclease SbcC